MADVDPWANSLRNIHPRANSPYINQLYLSEKQSRATDCYRRRLLEFLIQTDNPRTDNKSSRLQIFQIEEAIAEHDSAPVSVAPLEGLPITAIAGESVLVNALAGLFNANRALSTGDSAVLVGTMTEEHS